MTVFQEIISILKFFNLAWPEDTKILFNSFAILAGIIALIISLKNFTYEKNKFKFFWCAFILTLSVAGLLYIHHSYVRVNYVNNKLDSVIVYPLFMDEKLTNIYTMDLNNNPKLVDEDILRAIKAQNGMHQKTWATYILLLSLNTLSNFLFWLLIFKLGNFILISYKEMRP